MAASQHFYGDLLGMRRTLETTVSGEEFEQLTGLAQGITAQVCYFDGGVRLGQLELISWENADGSPLHAAGTTRSITTPGIAMISFSVESDAVARIYSTLVEHGVRCQHRPVSIAMPGYGEISAFIALDPDNNVVEFVALPAVVQRNQAPSQAPSL
jgi:catechol 2,3-dioxygenase-like lactoylglutathione lyase family enzyme